MLRKSLKLHRDQSERRNFAEPPGREMVTSARSRLCLQSERTGMEAGFFPHIAGALVFITELYRVMQATARWCCSVPLQSH